MSFILLTEEAFSELFAHVQADAGVSYAVSGGDQRYITGLGEVEVVEVTMHTSFFLPPVPVVPEAGPSPLDRLDHELSTTILEGCPSCGDLDATDEWCPNCEIGCDCDNCE